MGGAGERGGGWWGRVEASWGGKGGGGACRRRGSRVGGEGGRGPRRDLSATPLRLTYGPAAPLLVTLAVLAGCAPHVRDTGASAYDAESGGEGARGRATAWEGGIPPTAAMTWMLRHVYSRRSMADNWMQADGTRPPLAPAATADPARESRKGTPAARVLLGSGWRSLEMVGELGSSRRPLAEGASGEAEGSAGAWGGKETSKGVPECSLSSRRGPYGCPRRRDREAHRPHGDRRSDPRGDARAHVHRRRQGDDAPFLARFSQNTSTS